MSGWRIGWAIAAPGWREWPTRCYRMTLATVYVRGSVSDALILALTPLALAGLASYTDRRSLVGAAVAVLSILWMWRTQAGLALAVTVMLLIYALVVERGWLVALIVLASGAAGLVSLLPLWGVTATPATFFGSHFITLNTLLRCRGPRSGIARRTHRIRLASWRLRAASLPCGVVTLRRQRIPPIVRRLLWFSLGAALAAVLLALDDERAAVAVITRATDCSRYPWQALLVIAPLLVAPLGMLPLALDELEAPVYWAALLALVVVASLPHLTPTYTQVNSAAASRSPSSATTRWWCSTRR
jgi:hypothetical protein